MVTLKDLRNKGATPPVPFKKLADHILGKNYTLSVVFIGDTRMRNLNKNYRKKDKTTNILSFPLSDSEGEIFLNIKKIEEEAQQQNTSFKKYCAYIFIHGLLHLKGYSHGSTMESEEQKALRKFGFI